MTDYEHDHVQPQQASEQWLGRVLDWIDTTERNVAWLFESAVQLRDRAKFECQEALVHSQQLAENQFEKMQRLVRSKARKSAKRIGIASPADIDALNQSIDNLHETLIQWLENQENPKEHQATKTAPKKNAVKRRKVKANEEVSFD